MTDSESNRSELEGHEPELEKNQESGIVPDTELDFDQSFSG